MWLILDADVVCRHCRFSNWNILGHGQLFGVPSVQFFATNGVKLWFGYGDECFRYSASKNKKRTGVRCIPWHFLLHCKFLCTLDCYFQLALGYCDSYKSLSFYSKHNQLLPLGRLICTTCTMWSWIKQDHQHLPHNHLQVTICLLYIIFGFIIVR